MKIINLVEDTIGNNCENEHGLSFYIETNNHKLLVDSGASDMFSRNAKLLNIDLSQVDTFVLSHGHYDHAGGLPTFIKENNKAKIYIKNTAHKDYYHLYPDNAKYIGMDKSIMTSLQVVKVFEDIQLDNELFLFTDIKEQQYPKWSNEHLKEKVNDEYIQDTFSHEQFLVITQDNHYTLISGCAHNGILSILNRYHQLFGKYPEAVISGFHMMKNTEFTEEEINYIKHTAKELLKTNAQFFTGHCTGENAFNIMKKIMGNKLQFFHSGSEIKL